MENAPRYAKNKLQEASRAKDESQRVSVGFRTAAAALLLILATALLDYWFMLPMWVRLTSMILLVVLVSAGLYQFWKSLIRPTPLKQAALDAEAQKPDLGCEISTAAEYLSGERKPSLEYEGAIVQALEEKAARNLRTLNLPYWERSIRPAILLGAAILALVIFGSLATGAWTALQRSAMPWSQASYTQVEVKPGNVEIPVGHDLEVKSLFSGRTPEQAQFHWLEDGILLWQEALLTCNEKGDYVHLMKNVRTNLKYRVSGSDAVSPTFSVETYVPPAVKAWHVKLRYPEYTRRAPLDQDSPEITVLRGTTAFFQIQPSVKLAKAQLRFKDLPSIDLQPGENGRWSGEMLIRTNAAYWIELADEKGHRGGNESPYTIKALPDTAPKVEIPDPGQDMRAEATNNLPVRVTVTDDFGIQEIQLLYHRLGDPPQQIVARRNGETNTYWAVDIPLSTLNLQDHEVVAYHAEATDNNSLDGPGIGRSEVYFVEITNLESGSSSSQGKGQKVNLLAIQKQIIADTTALPAEAPGKKYDDLADRQKDALEFAQMYQDGLASQQASEEAKQEIAAAIHEMDRARELLQKHERNQALPPEESALARLYGLLKLLPELENLPTQPPPSQPSEKQDLNPVVNVVLEAIKKKQKEQPDPKEVADALEEAQRLQSEQANLNLGMQNSVNRPSATKPEQEKSQQDSSKQGLEQSSGQPGDDHSMQAGQSDQESKQPGEKEGQGKSSGLEKLAELEKALSDQAAALSEKLARMSGKDSRPGHNAAKKMSEAASRMGAAAQAMSRGDAQTAGTKGMQSEASLESAIALLERILTDRPERTDVSQEDFPKEYESDIAEYLKALSREE